MRGYEYLLPNGQRRKLGRRKGQGRIGKGISEPNPKRYNGTNSDRFIRKKSL